MLKLLTKTLYLFEESTIYFEHNSILIKNSDKIPVRIPLNAIEQIFIFGNVMISNKSVLNCSNHNIQISYIDMFGNFLGRFYGKSCGNVFLRKQQYNLYDNEEKSLDFTKNIVLGKSINSSNLLKYYSRIEKDNRISERLYKTANCILENTKLLKNCNNIDSVRGIEGSISSIYFSAFDLMLKNKDEKMNFVCRSKHHAENFTNSLLSFAYTLFTNNIASALECYGLDSQLGYLHRMRCGRASLSCDLIEEFRAPIIDKFIIKIINLKQIVSSDFEITQEGIILKDKKKFLKLWEDYRNEEIYHPLLDKKINIKLLPYIQSQLLSQYIRGDIEKYPPFYYKLF